MSEKARRGDETTLGGLDRDFPRTTAGFLDRLRRFGTANREGLEELCRRYWKPVYCFVRAGWAKTNEDAKDLTQTFFAWLLQSEVLAKYEPARAPFRTFLKGVVRRFVADQHKAEGRLKRGGEATLLRLQDDELPLADILEDGKAPDPEKAFDRAWLVALMRHAAETVKRRWAAEGRADAFRVFEQIDLERPAEPPTYAEAAARLKLSEAQVRNMLAAARRAVREEVQSELARQTGSREQFDEEWNALLGL